MCVKPNIVQYVAHEERNGYLYIIMEYVQLGDLQSCFRAGNEAVSEEFCQAVASQMCQALNYLHENGITHRDLKPDNILMESNNPYLFKLSDFGLSKIVTNEETFLDTFCGTLLYCAPEVYPGYERAMKGKEQPRAKSRRSVTLFPTTKPPPFLNIPAADPWLDGVSKKPNSRIRRRSTPGA